MEDEGRMGAFQGRASHAPLGRTCVAVDDVGAKRTHGCGNPALLRLRSEGLLLCPMFGNGLPALPTRRLTRENEIPEPFSDLSVLQICDGDHLRTAGPTRGGAGANHGVSRRILPT